MIGLFLASGGVTSNMIVYLIEEYNIKSIDAAQINNIIFGCVTLSPVAGAVISDGVLPAASLSSLSLTFYQLSGYNKRRSRQRNCKGSTFTIACRGTKGKTNNFSSQQNIAFESLTRDEHLFHLQLQHAEHASDKLLCLKMQSLVLFTLTSTIKSLRPASCSPLGSNDCESPSATQLATLYTAVALLSVGTGGTQFNAMTLGADQFDRFKDKESFFNWYFIAMYSSMIVSSTVIVYVQDSVSWGLGFGVCTVANGVSLGVLVMGVKYYRRPKARGSPFTGLARVVVAAVRKREVAVRADGRLNYHYGAGEEPESSSIQVPSSSFRFLNKAAVINEGEANTDDSIADPWRLCTVEQVEDLKTLIRISALWASSVFLSISFGIQNSLTVLQALSMDRTVGRRFTIPAGSMIVASLTTVAVVLPLIDRTLIPMCQKLIRRTPTLLQRIGLGHVFNALSMMLSSLVERKRASLVVYDHPTGNPEPIVPMSVLWLVVPLAVVGLGQALHFPGQVALYYQEFPKSLKSTATGVVALLIGIGFYVSTAVIDLVRKFTSWLPGDINESRLDKVFWMLAVVGAINFGLFVLCARAYECQSREIQKEDTPNDNTVE
ncbi:protein NRT1/ PTR FAMILY 2.3-like [Asparagus officinalis]|uniref:protein NRT1/ PTR FAMILY 2.3-like n=1 Tax=Asparagus officinalis TaxID=4686 RepID=UPI00098E3F0F|nr:protein NRT1/ PTR FAMILY 2.3-like [Asparagus officinalis]